MLDDLTAFFVTTDRCHATEALASVRRQGFGNPVIVIRNVYPMAEAYRRVLQCRTDYALVVDDDVVLVPYIGHTVFREFETSRAVESAAWLGLPRLVRPDGKTTRGGGVKLWFMPYLRQIGVPDVPHIALEQRKIATALGYRRVKLETVVGRQHRGSLIDSYKEGLWVPIREQHKATFEPGRRLRNLGKERIRRKAAETQSKWLLARFLGALDSERSGYAITQSKSETFIGPLGRSIDWHTIELEDLRLAVLDACR